MVTALVTADAASFREVVQVSPEAAAVGGGGLDLSAGDLFTVRDLLYALLLDSSNEAAAALAAHVEGDIDAFVEEMNRTVRSLGLRDTRFANPHGLDQPGHYSSASDLAEIAQALLDDARLARIVATPQRTISAPEGAALLENSNPLLETYQGAIGVKTGRTLGAGEVLVAAATRRQGSLIAVVMRSADAAADARELLDRGFVALEKRARAQRREARARAREPGLLLSAREEVGALVFDPGGSTVVVAGADLHGAIPPGPLDITFTPADQVLLPLQEGEEVGTVEVMSNGSILGTVPALARDPVARRRSSWVGRALSGVIRGAARLAAGLGA